VIEDLVTGFAWIFVLGYTIALIYGWKHRDDPFWRSFIDPLRLGKWDDRG